MNSRTYKVAGLAFRIDLEEPLFFMRYSQVVLDRIEKASKGLPGLDITPTRAGDEVPHRTLIQNKEEVIRGQGPSALDLSQYEPFRCSNDEKPLFSLKVVRGMEGMPPRGNLIMNVHNLQPYFGVYEDNGKPRYTLDENPETFEPAAVLCLSEDATEGTLYTANGLRPSSIAFQTSTALMIMFTYNGATRNTLLIHASVIGYKGKANIFLGKSGTGKSTHSKLWLTHIPEAELLNDDNPALSFDDNGNLIVYGTPWSGKTPCYRNICVLVRAIVRLDQAPVNEIEEESGLGAYATLIGSVSSIRWKKEIMEGISASIEKAAMGGTKFYHLSCLPDKDAAVLCKETTTKA